MCGIIADHFDYMSKNRQRKHSKDFSRFQEFVNKNLEIIAHKEKNEATGHERVTQLQIHLPETGIASQTQAYMGIFLIDETHPVLKMTNFRQMSHYVGRALSQNIPMLIYAPNGQKITG